VYGPGADSTPIWVDALGTLVAGWRATEPKTPLRFR
jgi:hypothetical protein